MTRSEPSLDVDALVFDAYGTLFDVHSVDCAGRGAGARSRRRAVAVVAHQAARIHVAGSLMSGPRAARGFRPRHRASARLRGGGARARRSAPAVRRRLREAYLTLAPFPDARAALARACAAAALDPVQRHARDARSAGATHGTRQPRRRRAFGRRGRHLQAEPACLRARGGPLQLPPRRIGFVSSNCWDAIGAKAFGFTTFWINRAGAPVDRHGPAPDRVITTLAELPPLLARSV